LKSASLTFKLLATRPATLTVAPAPNSTPWGLINQTRPLLLSEPKMLEGS